MAFVLGGFYEETHEAAWIAGSTVVVVGPVVGLVVDQELAPHEQIVVELQSGDAPRQQEVQQAWQTPHQSKKTRE